MSKETMSKETNIARRLLRMERAKPKIHTRESGVTVVEGYAAVFYNADDPGTEYQLWTDTYERIHPGAFDAAIAEDDVRGLTNHDPNWLLGRTRSKTLKLTADEFGLKYEITLPETNAGNDTRAMLERGDMDGSSFAFLVYGGKRGRVEWTYEITDSREIEVRNVYDVELLDVGPVTFPAYESTTSGLRAIADTLAEARSSRDRWQREQQADDEIESMNLDIELAEARLR